MIFNPSHIHRKSFTSIVILILTVTQISAQITPAKDSATKSTLSFYHSITAVQNNRSFQHIDYTLPKNQIVSWPATPLTATMIEERNEKWKQDNKIPNMIVKDVVQSILNKKKKVAVIPKF